MGGLLSIFGGGEPDYGPVYQPAPEQAAAPAPIQAASVQANNVDTPVGGEEALKKKKRVALPPGSTTLTEGSTTLLGA
jgi:hypothetical protein